MESSETVFNEIRTKIQSEFLKLTNLLDERCKTLLAELDNIEQEYKSHNEECNNRISEYESCKQFLNQNKESYSQENSSLVEEKLTQIEEKLTLIEDKSERLKLASFPSVIFNCDTIQVEKIISSFGELKMFKQRLPEKENLLDKADDSEDEYMQADNQKSQTLCVDSFSDYSEMADLPSPLPPAIPMRPRSHTELSMRDLPPVPPQLHPRSNSIQHAAGPLLPARSSKYNKGTPSFWTSRYGTGNGQMRNPNGTCICENRGMFFIADSDNNRVQIFSFDAKFAYMITTIKFPYDVCFYNECLYISHSQIDTITCYSLDGTLIAQMEEPKTNEKLLNIPMGLTIDEKTGLLYVCDYGNNRLQVFNSNLAYKEPMLTSILRAPLDIEVFRDWIIVLDEREYCIHIYNKDNGVVVNDVISRLKASAAYQIQQPRFFTVDAKANIIISDTVSHCLLVFSPVGNFIQKIGEEGLASGEFTNPTGVSVFQGTRIISVCSRERYQLQIF